MPALAKRPEQFVTRQRTEANPGGHGQQVKAERSGYAGHTGLAQQGFSVASVSPDVLSGTGPKLNASGESIGHKGKGCFASTAIE
jgi:hypothetical protein